MNFQKISRIIVIGAGAAGIAAATRLLEAGFSNVLILESENRIGGRIHTVPFGDNVIDLGAQWCHGEKQNVVFELVKNHNLLESMGTIYEDYKCIRSNKEIVPETQAEILKTIVCDSRKELQTELINYEGSLGAYLTEKYYHEWKKVCTKIGRDIAVEFFENFKKFECSIEASDHLFEVSGKGYLEYTACEGDLGLNWRDKGFKIFLKLLMKARDIDDPKEDLGLLTDRVLFNKRVENVRWNSSDHNPTAVIRCFNGELFEADHVICTVSLGVLKENYQRMFSPPLPISKCRAIEGLKLGTVDKFFLEFNEPFGPNGWTGFALLWREEDLNELRESEYFWLESVFGFYRVSHQPRLLQGWIIGEHARYMETLTETQVLEGLLWLLKKFLNFPVLEPINFVRTQWYENKNFRGSYTFRSMYTEELRTGAWDLASPITSDSGKPILQFAGESTHTHFYSTVHGAVESGWCEAQRLIDFYDRHLCKL